ncbi:MAG: carbamoyl-phosphate synthase small subunit [Micrococcales bacterium]|nr:carbamoyl-phosphate synthase small subunit [Microbacteriaceae bacterium]NBR22617.1 carbamoyl-phosphate synthase small subunit [Micrococcales bacterium]NBS60505.1 carbamoyl-phosphate synthase small subunit [Microbacteriaceae bacterium]NBS85536.1 carbamoyl-phosphate synthase small subunit [Micrococcales bacterium]NBX94148.1 carbamoyl-phosphate synthase small subunit [Actinomycetota bacterium]
MTNFEKHAILVLEDGKSFRGRSFGAQRDTLGEIVFATGMSGYQETLTDPSYAGQIVVQTAPHIGNTGMNRKDEESDRIWVSGYVVRDLSRVVSNHRSESSLSADLTKDNIPGISGLDTRALTLHLRDRGVMRAGIFTGEKASAPIETLIAEIKTSQEMKGRSLSAEVSTQQPYTVTHHGDYVGKVAILDLGIKRSTIENMVARGLDVEVLPSASTFEALTAAKADAVFYSNGPGDPETATSQVETLQQVLNAGIPFFGICFGNQLLGRALGFETYKLAFGHRGINQPVLDRRTGRVEVTAHNHGFAVRVEGREEVDSPAGFGKVRVSHVCLNDDVVEGLECVDIPAFSVQYHPEAAAGPHDANYLFDRLVEMIKNKKAN